MGLVEKRHAGLAVVGSSALFLHGGSPGTLHHLYFSGIPTPIMAIGATFSALEASIESPTSRPAGRERSRRMTAAIQTLMNEHRLIEKVLDSLATFVAKLENDPPEARETLAQYVVFFREFADRCHHGKEEDRLFARMAEHGFSPEYGPLKVMLQEHQLGRARVRELASIGDGKGPLSDAELQQARKSALEFRELLRAHIQKEDGILYPAAEDSVPASVLEALATEFEEFEREVMGEDSHARLHETAEQLIQAYPPASH